MRFSHRGTSREKGFALISALLLALLFLALIQILFLESSETYRSAMRFRSRVLAQALAESAVEIAARDLVNYGGASINAQNLDGRMESVFERLDEDGRFRIIGKGVTGGVFPMEADVEIEGKIDGPKIDIDKSKHTPGAPVPSGDDGSGKVRI